MVYKRLLPAVIIASGIIAGANTLEARVDKTPVIQSEKTDYKNKNKVSDALIVLAGCIMGSMFGETKAGKKYSKKFRNYLEKAIRDGYHEYIINS